MQHGRAVFVVSLPGFGGIQAPGRTVQQCQAGFRFKLADLLADGRCGHAQFARGSAHRIGFHHAGEDGHALQTVDC